MRTVKEAQASSPPGQRLADRMMDHGLFVPPLVAVAVLSFGLWILACSFSDGLLSFIAVLVISCP